MKLINLLLIGFIGLYSVPTVAQKRVSYAFTHQGIPSKEAQLNMLTEVTQPGSSFLRLYFKGTELSKTSYLLLEGVDGAQQKLSAVDLQNWNYSSAYFNGDRVKVSLFAAAGEKNTVRVSEIKVTDPQAGLTRNTRRTGGTLGTPPQPVASTASNITENYPYAKAVGRFTNGSLTGGTGWIAPNGAIVANDRAYTEYVSEASYDIIEFNVPPSIGTTVMHPSPQDQYPLLTRTGPHSFGLDFKNAGNEYDSGAGWMLFDPQPNGTGLRPGERQQQYFRIANNPRNSTINEQGNGNMLVDILHYGETNSDYLAGSTAYRTLRVSQTHLLPQNSNLNPVFTDDRELFVLYQLPWWGITDAGAPITFEGTNVAIGIHNAGNDLNLGHGRGFRDDVLRNELNDFYDPNSVYVDFDGVSNSPTGEIHRPYLFASQAAGSAPNGAQVYFAGGTYPGAVTFNRAMTLRAPVGTVKIGASPVGARKAAGSSIPSHWQEGAPSSSFDRESAEDVQVRAYPNPFLEQVEINYPFAEGGAISVQIFNLTGVPVATLTPNNATSAQNGVQWNGTDHNGMPVPAGLYLVKVNNGKQTFTTKVMKK